MSGIEDVSISERRGNIPVTKFFHRPGFRHGSMSDSDDESISSMTSESEDESTMSDEDVLSISKCQEDIPSWIESIVDYVKDTEANCLDLRTPPMDSFKSERVDIWPILKSLADSKITKLFLCSEDIFKGKMKEFSNILLKTKIEKLDLGWCDLEADDVLSLIAVLKDKQTITKVNISGGFNLTNDQVEEFSTNFPKSNLRSLDLSASSFLSFEKISVLLQMVQYTQITSLKLSNVLRIDQYDLKSENRVKILDVLMSSLKDTAVTKLDLDWNGLDDSSAQLLGSRLKQSELTKLNLRGNCISDSGVNFLVPGLKLSKITYLNLSRNNIDGRNCLGLNFKGTQIRQLDLSENPLTCGEIFYGFCNSTTIVDLKLCSYSNTGARAPLPFRELISKKLTSLDLTGINLSYEHITALAYIFCHSKLTQMNLQRNAFSREWYSTLSESLEESALQYINLARTARTRDVARGIASFLDETKNTAMLSVDLGYNDLSSNIALIASSLANTTLLELNLTGCSIGPKGLANLARQLESTAIVALNLNGNDIRDEGAAVLAKHLEKSKIAILNLMMNAISSHGAKAVAQVLNKTKLIQLCLSHNHIKDDGLESLTESAQNSFITMIHVSNNPGKRKLQLDRVLWENRRKMLLSANSPEKTAILTGDRNIFMFDHDFVNQKYDCVDDRVKFYKNVS